MSRSPRPGKEHLTTAREAGLSRFSPVSIIAGVLCAYGAFAIVAAIAGSLLAAFDVDTEFRTNDWASSGFVAGLVSGLVLLIAYLFGGYVAGRMARRSGMLHGLAVSIVSLVLGGIVGAVAGAAQDDGAIQDSLRGVGVPTSWDQVKGVAIASVIISLAAIIVGGILGGIRGERWHTTLARRVADPEVGPAADARAAAERDRERAERLDRDHDDRVRHDSLVAHEARRHDERRHDRDGDGRDDRTERDPFAQGYQQGQRDAEPPAAVDIRDDQQPHQGPFAGHFRR